MVRFVAKQFGGGSDILASAGLMEGCMLICVGGIAGPWATSQPALNRCGILDLPHPSRNPVILAGIRVENCVNTAGTTRRL